MSTPAGWYPDPTGRHQNRWFDGNDWTDQVADGQVVASDPVQADPGPDLGATQATPAPAATQPTVGAPAPPGAPPGAGSDPLGGYVSPVAADSGGGSSKVPLIVAAVVVVVLIAAGLVFALGGGDDGGDSASDSSGEQDQSDSPDEEEDDPSASDLFDDMADSSDSSDGGDDDVFDSDDTPADTVVEGEYPPEVIDNFVSSCTSTGSPDSFCNCVIDELQETVPFDRFVELDQQLAENPDDIPAELTAAATACQ